MRINQFLLSVQTTKRKDKWANGRESGGAALRWGRGSLRAVPAAAQRSQVFQRAKSPTHLLRMPDLCQLVPITLAKRGAASTVWAPPLGVVLV